MVGLETVRLTFCATGLVVLTTTKVECQVWELEVKKFVPGKCILHYNIDVNSVMMLLRKAKGG
jgi:hypothetical protein